MEHGEANGGGDGRTVRYLAEMAISHIILQEFRKGHTQRTLSCYPEWPKRIQLSEPYGREAADALGGSRAAAENPILGRHRPYKSQKPTCWGGCLPGNIPTSSSPQSEP